MGSSRKALFASAKGNRQHQRRRRRFAKGGWRAQETLETRMMLSGTSAEIFVTTDADGINPYDTFVSLREALELSATNGTDTDVIRFSLPEGGRRIRINPALGTLVVNSSVSIIGPDQGAFVEITVDPAMNGAGSLRGLRVSPQGDLTVKNLAIRGFHLNDGNGAGLLNQGHLSLERVDLSGNAAISGKGGGIYTEPNSQTAVSRVTIENSLAGSSGGAIFVSPGAIVQLDQVTIAGAASPVASAIENQGQLTVKGSTIASNGAGSTGVTIFSSSGASTSFANTLISGGNGIDVSGAVVSLGGNLVSRAGTSTGWLQSDDQVGGIGVSPALNALLGPIQDNGGGLRTIQLLAGSPAIDRGRNQYAPAVDQRGASRILDGPDPDNAADTTATVDIGAFEFGTFFVNTNNDLPNSGALSDGRVTTTVAGLSDVVSLRGAVQELNSIAGYGNGTVSIFQGAIMFNPGIRPVLSLAGTNNNSAASGDLDLFGRIQITGNGIDSTSIRGVRVSSGASDWHDRVFHVLPGSSVEFKSLYIDEGHVGFEQASGQALRWPEYSPGFGGIILNDGGNVLIADSKIGSFAYGASPASATHGGAVATRNGNLLVVRSQLTGFADYGGSLYVESGTASLDDHTVIDRGYANVAGGGVYVAGGILSVRNATEFTGNELWTERGTRGAGLAIGQDGTADIQDGVRFHHNAIIASQRLTETRGGAIYNAGNLTMQRDVQISDNGVPGIAPVQDTGTLGAGLYNEGHARIVDSVFTGNSSCNVGSAIFNSGEMVIAGTEFIGNHSAKIGGAIANANGTLSVDTSYFRDQNYVQYAGAIFNYDLDAELTVTNSTFEGNWAVSAGGAILNQSGNARIDGSTFLNNYSPYSAGVAGGVLNLGYNRRIADTPAMPLSLAAAVTRYQNTVLLEDVTPLLKLPLPIDIRIGGERMTVTAIDQFRDALTVIRSGETWHDVTDEVRGIINEVQTIIPVTSTEAISRYSLPLDVVVDNEVMTIVAVGTRDISVLRGRNGTSAAVHDQPAEIWGLSGSLAVSNSTFSGNYSTEVGSTLRNVIHPYVRPTVVENTTLMISHQHPTGLTTSSAGVSTKIVTQDEGVDWSVVPVHVDGHGQVIWGVPEPVGRRGNDRWKFDPFDSLYIRNSVVTQVYRGSNFAMNTGAMQDVQGYFRSGGNNFVSADIVSTSGTLMRITPAQTVIPVSKPDFALPPVLPFVARISYATNGALYQEIVLVTGVEKQPDRYQLTVVRGYDGTTAIEHPIAAIVTASATGFWQPGDKHGSLHTSTETRTSTIQPTDGITATQTTIQVADGSVFPRTEFAATITHTVNNQVFVEQINVLKVLGNVLTVVRGQRATQPIAHPKDATVDMRILVSHALDPMISIVDDNGGHTRTILPLPGSPLLERGLNNDGPRITLPTAISATDTLVAVSDISWLPVPPPLLVAAASSDSETALSRAFLLKIGDEQVLVTAVDYENKRLRLVRGFGGSAAVVHSSGTQFVWGANASGGASPVGRTIPVQTSLTSSYGLSVHVLMEPRPGSWAVSTRLGIQETELRYSGSAQFPSVPFFVLVESELMKVTAVAPGRLTVQRGIYGGASEHAIGVSIEAGVSATASSTQLRVESVSGLPDAPFVLRSGTEFLSVLSVNRVTGIMSVVRGDFQSTSSALQPGEKLSTNSPDIRLLMALSNDTPPLPLLTDLSTRVGTHLAQPADGEGTILFVDDISVLPAAPFYMIVSNEIIKVTTVLPRSGVGAFPALVVLRGQFGTVAASHAVGSLLVRDVDVITLGGSAPIPNMSQDLKFLRIGEEIVEIVLSQPSERSFLVRRGAMGTSVMDHKPGTLVTFGEKIVDRGSQTRMVIPSISQLPAVPWIIQVGSERMLVTGTDPKTDTLIVQRGAQGTLPASHGLDVDSNGGTLARIGPSAAIPVESFLAANGHELLQITFVDPATQLATIRRGQFRTVPVPLAINGTLLFSDTGDARRLRSSIAWDAADFSSYTWNEVTHLTRFSSSPDSAFTTGYEQTRMLLSEAVSASTAQFFVSDSANAQLSLPAEVQVDAERMRIVASETVGQQKRLTVIRGIGGTTATTHLANAIVRVLADQRGGLRELALSATVARKLDSGSAETGHFVVSTFADATDSEPGNGFAVSSSGATSLRSVIMEAEIHGLVTTIQLGEGTYSLSLPEPTQDGVSGGDLDIRGRIIIRGRGANLTAIDAAGLTRIFDVFPGAQLTLSGLRLSGGLADFGGAIRVTGGKLTMEDVYLDASSASHGGAIYSQDSQLEFQNVTLAGNSASVAGGGIEMLRGSGHFSNVTVSGNSAVTGGAIYAASSALTLTNNTITKNTAQQAGGIFSSADLQVANSILAENAIPGQLNSESADVVGHVVSLGSNLVGIRRASGFLAGSMTATSTSMTYSGSTTSLPSVPFLVRIGTSEIATVTAVNGALWTLARPSNATVHAIGEEVRTDGFWISSDLVGTSSLPKTAGLQPLSWTDSTVPKHELTATSIARDAGTNSLYQSIDLRVAFNMQPSSFGTGRRVIYVNQWDHLPPAPFKIRIGDQVERVLEVSGARLVLAEGVYRTYSAGDRITLLTETRNLGRIYSPGGSDIPENGTGTGSGSGSGSSGSGGFGTLGSGSGSGSSSGSGGTGGGTTPAPTGPIPHRIDIGAVEYVPILRLSSGQTTKAEGNTSSSPGTTFSYTVTRSGNLSGTTTVSYEVEQFGAAPAMRSDFKNNEMPYGTLTFLDGETSKTFDVTVLGDSIVERNESFRVVLRYESDGAAVLQRDAVNTIQDDDSATITVSNVSITEGDRGKFAITLQGNVDAAFAVGWETLAGTASTTDFLPSSGQLSFTGANGETLYAIVPTGDDSQLERNETFTIQLAQFISGLPADMQGRVVPGAQGTGTILNNDLGQLIASPVRIVETDSGTIQAQVAVTYLGATADTGFSVTAATQTSAPGYGGGTGGGSGSGGTTTGSNATSGTDFLAASTQLSFTGISGEVRTFNITILGDLLLEQDEVLTAALSELSAAGREAGISLVNGTIQIIDNDSAGVVIGNPVATENSGTLVFPVTALKPFGPFTVTVATSGGTATSWADYAPVSTVLSFSGTNRETLWLTVPLINDNIVETTETITAALSNLTGNMSTAYRLVNGTGTINNDDSASVTITALPTVPGATTVSFSVTLNGQLNAPLTVTAATAGETALSGLNYQEKTETLVFAGTAGETKTFTVNVVPGTEQKTFGVRLTTQDSRSITVARMAGGLVPQTPQKKYFNIEGYEISPLSVDGISQSPDLLNTMSDSPTPKPSGDSGEFYYNQDGSVAGFTMSGGGNATYYDIHGTPAYKYIYVDGGYDAYGYYPNLGGWVLVGRVRPGQFQGSKEGQDPEDDNEMDEAREKAKKQQEENEKKKPPVRNAARTVETDWTVPYNQQIVVSPFTTFNYRLDSDVVLTISDPAGNLVPVGSVLKGTYGTFRVNSDLTLTYTPDADVAKRFNNPLLPELDAQGEIYRFAGIEEFKAHLVSRTELLAGRPAQPLASASGTIAVANELPILQGTRQRDARAGFYLDAPVFTDFLQSSGVDLRHIYADLEGEEALSEISIVDITYNGKSAKDNFEDPDGGKFEIKAPIGKLVQYDMYTGLIPVGYTEKFLTIRKSNSHAIEIYNDVSSANAQSSNWDINGYPISLEIKVVLTDGTMYVNTEGKVIPYTWETTVFARPNVYRSASLWRTQAGVPGTDYRSWVQALSPSLPNRDPDAGLKIENWSLTASARESRFGADYSQVGGVDVDLFNGTMRRDHSLILDMSGGTSELAVTGLTYDSSTVHSASKPIIQGRIQRESNEPVPTLFNVTLKWFGRKQTASGVEATTTTVSRSVPVSGSAEQLDYIFAIEAPEWPPFTGVYGWEMQVEIVTAAGAKSRTVHGETPVVVGDGVPIFGAGWNLTGVPILYVDDRDNLTGSGSKTDDRIVLAGWGEAPRLFDASPLTRENFHYSGVLRSVMAGSLAIGTNGYTDTNEYGTLTSNGATGEIVYRTADGTEYWFTGRTFNNQRLYLVSRIEQPGLDFDPATATGRRGVSFAWTLPDSPGAHPLLSTLTSSDGAVSTFSYDAAGYLSSIDVHGTAAQTVIRRYEFSIDSNHDLNAVNEVSSENVKREFTYTNHRMTSDAWRRGTAPADRYVEMTYDDPQTGRLTGIRLGRPDEAIRPAYAVKSAASIGFSPVSIPGGGTRTPTRKDLIAEVSQETSYQRFDEVSGLAVRVPGSTVDQFEFDFRGLAIRTERFFQPGANSSGRVSQSKHEYVYDHLGSLKIDLAPGSRDSYYWYDYETSPSYAGTDRPDIDDTTPKYDPDDYRGNVTRIVSPTGVYHYEYETDDEKLLAVGKIIREVHERTINGAGRKQIVDTSRAETLYFYDGDHYGESDASTSVPAERLGNLTRVRKIRGKRDGFADAAPDPDTIEADPGDYVENWSYVGGMLSEYVNASGLRTTYAYDSLRRLQVTTQIDAGLFSSEQKSQISYDSNGFVNQVTNSVDGVISSTIGTLYSPFGLLLTSSLAGKNGSILRQSSFEYMADGMLRAVVDGLGVRSENHYSSAGLLKEAITGVGKSYQNHFLGSDASVESISTYAYNSDGTLREVLSPDGSVTTWYRDLLAHTEWVVKTGVAGISTVTPAGSISTQFETSVEKSQFDSLGRTVRQINLLTGAQTEFTYGDLRFDAPTSTTTSFLAAVGDAGETSVSTIQRFDALGNVLLEWVEGKRKGTEEEPLSSVPYEYKYDELGYLKSSARLNREGLLTKFSTNEVGQVTKVTKTDPRSTDEKAKVTTISNTYDHFGRLRVTSDSYISADNDEADKVRARIPGIPLPAGPVVAAETIDFVIDSASGRIEEVRRSRSGTVARRVVDAAGQVVKEYSELGLVTDHAFDLNGNEIRTETTAGPGQSIPSMILISDFDQQNRLRKRTTLDTTPADGVDSTRTEYTDYRAFGDAPLALDIVQTTVLPGVNGGVIALSGMNIDSLGNLILELMPGGQVAHLVDQDGVARSGDESYASSVYSAPLTIRSYKYGTRDGVLNDLINEIRVIQTGALPLDLSQQLVANPSFEGARTTRTEYGTTGLPLVEDSERSIYTMGSRKISQYDRFGRLSLSAYATEGTSGLTDQKTFSYDDSDEGTSTGKLAEVSEANGRKTYYRYDNEGRMLSMSDKADETGVIAKKWSYDGLGRQISERTRINAEGQGSNWATRSWTYLGSGTLQTDADGTEIMRRLDPATLTASEYAYTGQSSSKELFFQSVSQLNSDGSVREVREQTLPTNSESPYQRLPGSETKVLLKYDELGRLLSDSTSGQTTGGSIPLSSVAYQYGTDSGSLTANISRNVGQHVSDLRMTSDVLGRVTSLLETLDTQAATQWLGDVRGENKLVSVQYVLDGHVASIRRNAVPGTTTMPHRGVSVYTYAWDGRVDSLTHFRDTLQPSTGAPVSRYSMSFNLAGDVTSETAKSWTANASAADWATASKNIVNSTKAFEYQGQQLSKVTLTDAVAGTTQEKTFALDTNGNNTEYMPAGSGYDNRIEGTENGDTTHLFEFNREGRMTHHRSITDLSGEKDSSGRKSGVWTNTQEIFAYTWDHRGRLLEVRRTTATGTRTYTNGMVNEQAGSTSHNDPSTWVRFIYDGLNRLILRTELVEQGSQPVAVSTTRYVYDSTGLVMELVAKGASPATSDFQITRHYLNGPGDVGVLAVDQTRAAGLTSPLAGGGQTATLWAFANPGGTVSTWGYVDAANAWHLSQDLYDETGLSLGRFGQLSGGSRVPLSSSEQLLQEAPFVWRGLTFDAAADVFMVGSTAVDPDTGRFLSQAGPGANPYLFAANQFSSDSTFDPVESYNGLNSVYTNDFNRAFGQRWIGFAEEYFGAGFAANAGGVAYYGAFVGVIAGSVAGSVLGGSLLTAGSGISAIWGGASLAAEAFIAGTGSSLIEQAVALKPGESLDWNEAIVDGLFSAGETGLVSGATTGLKAMGKMGHMHGGGDELLGSSLGGLLGDTAGMAYDSYQLGNSLSAVVGGGAEEFRSLAVGLVIDAFGGGGGGHGRLQGRHFCFTAGTPVSVAMEFVSLSPLTPLVASDRTTDDGSGAWIACGFASMIAASVLSSDRKKRSRQIPETYEWESEGQWWFAEDPELDVSQLDFEDVCGELLSGSPGMN